MLAPSFCACLTEEFMNTVQREPRSTGVRANRPSFAKSSIVVSQRAGERLQERAAAGGTGLVEEDVVDHAVVDLEALDILPADVDDEIDVRA